jgi:hypothetical protein
MKKLCKDGDKDSDFTESMVVGDYRVYISFDNEKKTFEISINNLTKSALIQLKAINTDSLGRYELWATILAHYAHFLASWSFDEIYDDMDEFIQHVSNSTLEDVLSTTDNAGELMDYDNPFKVYGLFVDYVSGLDYKPLEKGYLYTLTEYHGNQSVQAISLEKLDFILCQYLYKEDALDELKFVLEEKTLLLV